MDPQIFERRFISDDTSLFFADDVDDDDDDYDDDVDMDTSSSLASDAPSHSSSSSSSSSIAALVAAPMPALVMRRAGPGLAAVGAGVNERWEDVPLSHVERMPAVWPLDTAIVLNIERTALLPFSTMWGHFNLQSPDRVAQKCLLFLFAKAASSVLPSTPALRRNNNNNNNANPDSGGGDGSGGGEAVPRSSTDAPDLLRENGYFRYVCNDGIRRCLPKVSVILELLTDESGECRGWRFFFIGHDPTFNISNVAYKTIIDTGLNHMHQRRRAREGCNASVNSAECYRTLRLPLHFIKIAQDYFSSCPSDANPFFNDDRRSNWGANPCFADAHHPFNPQTIFSIENAMSVRVDEEVCVAQRTLSNYVYAQDPHGNVTDLRFPRASRVWKMTLADCIPAFLHSLAIPHILHVPLGMLPPPPLMRHPAADQPLPQLEDVLPDVGDDDSHHAADDLSVMPVEQRLNIHALQAPPGGGGGGGGVQAAGRVRYVGHASEEGVVVDRSFLLVMRLRNCPENGGIRLLYQQAINMAIDDPNRPLVMTEYRRQNIAWKQRRVKDLWGDLRSCDCGAAKISPVVKQGISFFKALPEIDLYPERNQFCYKMSPYFNMRVHIHDVQMRVHRFKSGMHARRMWQLLIARTSALTYSFELHINWIFTGKKAVGKSYLFKCLRNHCFPGSTDMASRMTRLAFTTDEDWNDVCLIIDEAEGHLLGVDERGNPVSGDEIWKGRLTNNVVRTVRCAMVKITDEAGEETTCAKRVTSTSRCMGNCLMTTNINLDPENPLISRFVYDIVTPDPAEGSHNVADIAYPLKGETDLVFNNTIFHEDQVLHVYEMLVEKAIEAGVLEDVNTDIAGIHFRRIFERLHNKHGMPKVDVRVYGQLLGICRIAAIKHAIYIVYCTELSKWRRDPTTGHFRRFDPLSLLDVERYLVVTEEIVADILTLCQDIFIPLRYQRLIDVCNQFYDHAVPSYRKIRLANGQVTDDRNYIQFGQTSVEAFLDSIADATAHKISSGLAKQLVSQLQKEHVCVTDANDGAHSQIRIAIVRIDPDPDIGPQARRISIALERLNFSFRGDALEECLLYSLQYRGCRARRIITSLKHTKIIRRRGSSGGGGGAESIKQYPNLLHSLDIQEKPNVLLFFDNQLSLTKSDYALRNRTYSQVQTSNNQMQTPIIPIIGDLEEQVFRAHWNLIGAPFHPDYLPWNISKLIWNYRRAHAELYGNFEIFSHYPEEAVVAEDAVRAKKRETRQMMRAQEESPSSSGGGGDNSSQEQQQQNLQRISYAEFSGSSLAGEEDASAPGPFQQVMSTPINPVAVSSDMIRIQNVLSQFIRPSAN